MSSGIDENTLDLVECVSMRDKKIKELDNENRSLSRSLSLVRYEIRDLDNQITTLREQNQLLTTINNSVNM